jgi:hypothetical protein
MDGSDQNREKGGKKIERAAKRWRREEKIERAKQRGTERFEKNVGTPDRWSQLNE